jgi:hypothetical protein
MKADARNMKYRTIPALLTCLVIFSMATNWADERHPVTIKYPTDLRFEGKNGITSYSLDFVLHPVTDLRLMYCDESTIRRRIADGVCIVDVNGSVPIHKEITVSSNSTLDDVIKKSGVPHVVGVGGVGQRGVRIISQKAILVHNEAPGFLQTKISAGDFIVVLPMD